MRKFIVLSAVAPLAMLAACADNDADETVIVDDAEATAMTEPAPVDDGTMATGPATSITDAGDYSGSYGMSAPDGSTQNVTLNSSDNTYSYMGEDGTERTGNYTVADDGYRINFGDFYGEPAFFTISNGDLVRLQGDTAVTADREVTGQRYSRSTGEDDAVFSREPSIGSPVTPEQ